MEKKQVISHKNLPAKLPIMTTLVVVLALSHWNAAGWVWGVVMTFVTLLWVSAIYAAFNQEQVDIFELTELAEVKNFAKAGKSKFMQKLQEAMKITNAERTKMSDIRQGDTEY